MSAAENQEDTTNTEPDNVDVGLVGTITVVGALLVIAIAAALTALVRVEQNRRGDDVGAYADLGAVSRLKAEQRDRLNAAPKWSDKAKGLVSIPIDRAMNLVSEDIQRQPALATPTAPGGASADAGVEAGPDAAAAPAEAGAEQESTETPAPTPAEAPAPGPHGSQGATAPTGAATAPAPQPPAPKAPSATPAAPKPPGGTSAAPKPKQPTAPKGSTTGAPTTATPTAPKPGATAPAAGGRE